MNLYFVYGSGPSARIVTPALTGTLLPGVTRDSLLTVAHDLGYTATHTDEWIDAKGGIHSAGRLRRARGEIICRAAVPFFSGSHQTKALRPVMARPTTNVLISRVPSYE